MDYIEITERTIRHSSLRFIVKIENKKRWRGGVCRWSQQWLSNLRLAGRTDASYFKVFKNRFLSSVRFHFSCPPSPDSGFDIHCITLWSSCLEERGLGTSGRATPSIIRSIMRDKQDPNQLRTTPTLLSLTGCLIDIWECKDLWFPVIGILISNAVHSN